MILPASNLIAKIVSLKCLCPPAKISCVHCISFFAEQTKSAFKDMILSSSAESTVKNSYS